MVCGDDGPEVTGQQGCQPVGWVPLVQQGQVRGMAQCQAMPAGPMFNVVE